MHERIRVKFAWSMFIRTEQQKVRNESRGRKFSMRKNIKEILICNAGRTATATIVLCLYVFFSLSFAGNTIFFHFNLNVVFPTVFSTSHGLWTSCLAGWLAMLFSSLRRNQNKRNTHTQTQNATDDFCQHFLVCLLIFHII